MPIPNNKSHEFFMPNKSLLNEIHFAGLSFQIPFEHLMLLRLFSSNTEELTVPHQ